MTVPDFIPLADVIRPRPIETDGPVPSPGAHEGAVRPSLHVVPPLHVALNQLGACSPSTNDDDLHPDVRSAVRDARLFRARLADTFDDSVARVLRELAVSVLARELRLAPCDLVAIVRRIAERTPVVRLRLAPIDASCAAARDFGIPVVEDSALEAGDAVLEIAGGDIDARLGLRLAAVLEAVS